MGKDSCNILISPTIATRHQAGVGSSLSVTGLYGPVTCQIAGLGAGDFMPVTIIGPGGSSFFVPPGKTPDFIALRPLPGSDWEAIENDLLRLQARYAGRMFISLPDDELRAVTDTSDQLMGIFNGMVFLGILGAALGMVNTMLASLLERQREFGLLRAVGASPRQLTAIVMGEAAVTALLGALLGTGMGFGMGGIFALAFGGNNFGLVDLNLHLAAWNTLAPAWQNGWWAVLASPLLAAGAVFPAARRVLQGSVIHTLQPEH
jgi:putative ABC transport system permease protein